MIRLLFLLILMPGLLGAQALKITVKQIDNSIFKKDNYWEVPTGLPWLNLPQVRFNGSS